MKSSEAEALVRLLASLYSQYGEWSEDRCRVFAAAIEDMPFEAARQAVVQWSRTGKRAPLPGDIRELAQQVPVERGLPAPDYAPRPDPGEGIGGRRPPVCSMSDWERKRLTAYYLARTAETGARLGRPVRLNRPDLAYEARRLGLDSAPFLADDEGVEKRRGESVSGIVQRVLDARVP